MTSKLNKVELDASVMLDAIRHAQARFIVDLDPQDSFDDLLSIILTITESEYGFIGEVFFNTDGTPYLRAHAMSDIAWSEESKKLYQNRVPGGFEFHNPKTLFGHVMTSGKPVISNDPDNDPRSAGLP